MRDFGVIKKIRPNPLSVKARLPEVYKKYLQELKRAPAPVHYIPEQGKWKKDPETGQKLRIENVPIPLMFTKEADEGIWGGESVVKGFIKYKLKRRRLPQYWVPKLKRAVLYSEILNKYMFTTVTERTLQLIDQHYGFDNYILETPVQDLRSQLALDLRRKMLLTLINKEQCHDNPSEQQKIWDKYKKFEISKEEAEWFGLSVRNAIIKQRVLEEKSKEVPPLKHYYRKSYFEKLKSKSFDETEGASEFIKEKSRYSWMKNIPFFGKKSEEKTDA